MAELATFATDAFDLLGWVNDACTKRPEDETMEKYLARLEMRLHLAAEDVEANIESEGKRALARIPIAISEVSHVQGDVASLDSEVRQVLSQLQIASEAASESTGLLRDADLAKGRMEDACTTLKDASELSELWASVETLFAEGDVQRIATALATMRRSVSLVGHVPEFQGSSQRLAGLEERFQNLIEPQLAFAMSNRDGSQVQQLAGLMITLGRTAHVERTFVSARLPHMLACWEKFQTDRDASFLAWLPSWCDDVISSTNDESSWCVSHLPEQHPQLVLELLAACFARIDGSHRARLAHALASDPSPSGAIEGIISVCAAVEGLMSRVQGSILDAAVPDLQTVAAGIYGPLCDQIDQYGAFEARQLDAAFPQLPPAGSLDIEGTIVRLEEAAEAGLHACEQALQRCQALCTGTELPSLALVCNDRLAALFGDLQGHAASIRAQSLPAVEAHAAGRSRAPPSPQDNDAVLPLLNVYRRLSQRLGSLTQRMNAAAGVLLGVLGQQHADSLTITSHRLRAESGRLLRALRDFSETASSPGFVLLPSAAKQAHAFGHACESLIFDVLMMTVRTALAEYSRLPAWSAASPNPALNLPSFSSYPQAQVTAAGEYLMMLPQHLEALLTGSDDSSGVPVDAEWLDRVAVGAADMLTDQLSAIKGLKQQGAQQLAADLEYFCNVLSALGVAPPTALATWQVAAGWSAPEFSGLASSAVEEGADRATLERIADARGLVLG